MIYVITHKIFDDKIIDHLHYKVIHVGQNQDSKDEYLRDDTQGLYTIADILRHGFLK